MSECKRGGFSLSERRAGSVDKLGDERICWSLLFFGGERLRGEPEREAEIKRSSGTGPSIELLSDQR